MNPNSLVFEEPITELQVKIEELKSVSNDSDLNISEEIAQLEEKRDELTTKIFSDLSAWQICQLARHPQRPYSLEYFERIFDDFDELHGDRLYGDDEGIVGGIANLGKRSVMILGHQKGRDTKEKIKRNFGMPRPEGYRKALRLMEMAERFNLPILTFLDTPGAYPGLESEERGMSEAIAKNLAVMSRLKVPIISTVIGEGSSGGALGIGVCDHLFILQYATYSVISPEGCASILWRNPDKAEVAAEAMAMTAKKLLKLGIADEIIKEPLGGAHRDIPTMAERIKENLEKRLHKLEKNDVNKLLRRRYKRLRGYGAV